MKNNDFKMCKYTIDYGADAIKDALNITIKKDFIDMFKFLITYYYEEFCPKIGWSRSFIEPIREIILAKRINYLSDLISIFREICTHPEILSRRSRCHLGRSFNLCRRHPRFKIFSGNQKTNIRKI